MQTLKVMNTKCGGCEKTIQDSLSKEGITNISIDAVAGEVYFDGDTEKAEKILAKLGYPKVGSLQADNFLKKAKSYISCLVGKTKK